ncbi:hypothetical protein [Pseudomonas frederiksbergensis]|uniref:hypothetical protein n=1 Tax=Pseudomonas frederiksbergensis TaxID=104087 RepID=UPI002DC0479A|nr:hypothetical protein [Pseudomonas frederiksbergensis]WRV69737.1 hypothetical protein VQ575_06685 [Pseudomonas frederiksbergensis]
MQPQSEPSVMKAVFDQLKEAHFDICKHINFIDITDPSRSPEADLEKAGIKYDSILRFTDNSIKSLADGGYTMASADGYTVNFLLDDAPQSAIFLGSTPSGISQEDSESLFWTLQILFVYHELMHAKDLKIEKNFSLSDRKVDLVKAEIYADISTLRFFAKHQKSGADVFRNLYAAGILGRAKTPIYTRIFNGITKSFPEAQLKAWASNSILPPKTQ